MHCGWGGQRRTTPGLHPADVCGLHARERVGECDGGADAERDRPEIAGAGRREQLVQIVTTRLEEAPRRLLASPRLQTQPRLAPGRKLELLTAPGTLHHLPRVALSA